MTRDVFAEALGVADDTVQAEFLNGFVRSLKVSCKGHPGGSMSVQAYCVAKQLHADTVAFLRDLVETADHLRDEYSDEKVSQKYEQIRELEKKIAERKREVESLG